MHRDQRPHLPDALSFASDGVVPLKCSVQPRLRMVLCRRHSLCWLRMPSRASFERQQFSAYTICHHVSLTMPALPCRLAHPCRLCAPRLPDQDMPGASLAVPCHAEPAMPSHAALPCRARLPRPAEPPACPPTRMPCLPPAFPIAQFYSTTSKRPQPRPLLLGESGRPFANPNLQASAQHQVVNVSAENWSSSQRRLTVADHCSHIGRQRMSATPVSFLTDASWMRGSPMILTNGVPSLLFNPSASTNTDSLANVILKPTSLHALIIALRNAGAGMPNQACSPSGPRAHAWRLRRWRRTPSAHGSSCRAPAVRPARLLHLLALLFGKRMLHIWSDPDDRYGAVRSRGRVMRTISGAGAPLISASISPFASGGILVGFATFVI